MSNKELLKEKTKELNRLLRKESTIQFKMENEFRHNIPANTQKFKQDPYELSKEIDALFTEIKELKADMGI